jgi:serine/threonine-protein kinase
MAIVYEAVHVRLGQRVALKILLPELAEREDIMTRFEREGRAAVRLRSPHVARVFDVDTLADGTAYIVMEFLEGRDLAGELALSGPLPITQAVDYVLQACDAMAEAHRQGTVHRDLKPSNLFLAQDGKQRIVKVLDFGVSKVALEGADLSVTSTRSALGTALYMSPEQVRSAKSVDARTDVWSLGVVLYELLTARTPFEGESVTALAAAIVTDTPPPLRTLRADVPFELEQVVIRAMEKDRDKRFHDAAAFAAALAPFGPSQENSGTVTVLSARSDGSVHLDPNAGTLLAVHPAAPPGNLDPTLASAGMGEHRFNQSPKSAGHPIGGAPPFNAASRADHRALPVPAPAAEWPALDAPDAAQAEVAPGPAGVVHSVAPPSSELRLSSGAPQGAARGWAPLARRPAAWVAVSSVLAAVVVIGSVARRAVPGASLFSGPQATGSTTILWNLSSAEPAQTGVLSPAAAATASAPAAPNGGGPPTEPVAVPFPDPAPPRNNGNVEPSPAGKPSRSAPVPGSGAPTRLGATARPGSAAAAQSAPRRTGTARSTQDEAPRSNEITRDAVAPTPSSSPAIAPGAGRAPRAPSKSPRKGPIDLPDNPG